MNARPLQGWMRTLALITACQMITLSLGPPLAQAAEAAAATATGTTAGSAVPGTLATRAPALLDPVPDRPQEQEKLTIGVIDLDAEGVEDSEARAITGRLRIWLGRTGTFEVIERNQMENIMEEMGFQFSGACDTDECVVQVGRILGASKMVAGSVSKVGTLYSLQIRIIDITTSRIEHTSFADEPGGIEAVMQDATRKVADELALYVRGEQAAEPAVTVQDPVIDPGRQQDDPTRQQADPEQQATPQTDPGETGEPGEQQRPRRRNGWLWLLLIGGLGGGAALALGGGGGGDSGPDPISSPPTRPDPPQLQ